MKYMDYELKDYIVNALKDLKFKEFTDIQKEVFNNFNSNKNIIAKSKTGSGKTHAFLIPIFNNLDENNKTIFSTIIAPTKELATQIYKMAQHIASFSPTAINIKLYTSGNDREREIEKLADNQPQIVIGTPGRVLDMINKKILSLSELSFFVIDDIKQIIERDFIEIISNILNHTNEKCQKAIFINTNEYDPLKRNYSVNIYNTAHSSDMTFQLVWL